MKDYQMSHNACYEPSPLSLLAVPKGFNLDRCRFRVCVYVRSDMTRCQVFFYRYHGMYWYSLHVLPCMSRCLQSHPYLSIRNCIADFRAQMRQLQFVIDTPDVLRELSRIDAVECRNLAAEIRRPTTWRA